MSEPPTLQEAGAVLRAIIAYGEAMGDPEPKAIDIDYWIAELIASAQRLAAVTHRLPDP